MQRDPQTLEYVARRMRQQLLAETDIHVLRCYERGAPVPPQLVAYRQALRDVTQQPGWPDAIAWPELQEPVR